MSWTHLGLTDNSLSIVCAMDFFYGPFIYGPRIFRYGSRGMLEWRATDHQSVLIYYKTVYCDFPLV